MGGGDKKKKPRKKDKLKNKLKEEEQKNQPPQPVPPKHENVLKTFQGIKESLREGTQSKNSNYDYLMSLFDQYDSTKPDNLNMIQNHQKENKEKINTYIDKIS